jgi:hypothetical protein
LLTLLWLLHLLGLLLNLNPLNIVWHFGILVLWQVDVLSVSLEDAISDSGQLTLAAMDSTQARELHGDLGGLGRA